MRACNKFEQAYEIAFGSDTGVHGIRRSGISLYEGSQKIPLYNVSSRTFKSSIFSSIIISITTSVNSFNYDHDAYPYAATAAAPTKQSKPDPWLTASTLCTGPCQLTPMLPFPALPLAQIESAFFIRKSAYP